MQAEQAIFTSLARDGRAGYHVVARSTGVRDDEARALATWSPSHGGLVVDDRNRTSVNFHPLPGGRFALSRTCEGPAEYSGRGGRQVYTHALIVDEGHLRRSDFQPIALYRAALALGLLRYRPEPGAVLASVALCEFYPARDARAAADRAAGLGLADPEALRDTLVAGGSFVLPSAVDRIALVECLLGLLPASVVSSVSFATSLRPSAVRPFRVGLAG